MESQMKAILLDVWVVSRSDDAPQVSERKDNESL